MRWITAEDIDNWTSREPRRAQETIPLLVWKLILASCRTINDCHFPFASAIQYSGYDGVLDTNDMSPFFPSGKSVWEIGTNENVLEKFSSDYAKRTAKPDGIDQANTAFCFVSSRIWKHTKGITELTEEKLKDRVWKSVRIIDATTLSIWLKTCPAVCSWLSAAMGMPYDGVRDIYDFWRNTVSSTEPKLSEDYFLYKRSSCVQQLQEICSADKPTQIVLACDSWLEAVLCIAAEISATKDLSLRSFGEKCVIADTLEAVNEIDAHCTDMIVIPTFLFSDMPFTVRKNTIIIPVDRYNPLNRISKSSHRIEIPSRTRHEFCGAIEKLGYDSQEAFDLGQSSPCFPHSGSHCRCPAKRPQFCPYSTRRMNRAADS